MSKRNGRMPAIRRAALAFCRAHNHQFDKSCPSNRDIISAVAKIKGLPDPQTKQLKNLPPILNTPPPRKNKATPKLDNSFYETREWRELRYQVLIEYGGACQCCGRSYRKHGVIIHVDHIKPKSLYPELAFDKKNLQVLCEDCNMAKSNKDETDWRVVERSKRTTPITPSSRAMKRSCVLI